MIKKYLLGIGITILGLIGFSSAGITVPISHVGLNSTIDSNYHNVFLKGGGFLTQYLGQGRNLLALRNNVLVWWATNGFPYFYLGSNVSGVGNEQGFPDRFYSCDEIIGEVATMPGNCSLGEVWDFSGDYSNAISIFKSFFDKVVIDDYVYYDYVNYRYVGATWGYVQNFMHICWSSHEIGRSLCFKVGRDTGYGNGGNLVFSQNLNDLTFAKVPYSWIGYGPGQAGYGGGGNIEGGSNTSDQVIMTGDLLYQKCTNSYVLSQIDKTYGSQMFRPYCHAGTFDTGSIIGDYTGVISYVPGLGVDFKYVYNNTNNGQSWNHWYESNLNAMARYKNGDFGPTNPFMGSPLYLYTYFENLYNGSFHLFSDISSYDVLNYCQLMLYSDLDSEYKGSYYKSYCDDLQFKNDFSNITTGEVGTIDDDEILPPGFDIGGGGDTSSSGTVVGADWSGVLSGDTNKNYDGKNFINDFYQKLKSSYQKPVNGSSNGIIPSYILTFLFALILFRFLSH